MAERKPLFQSTEGFSEEMAQADSITLGGLTMGGPVDMGDFNIINVPTPVDPDDAANKAYVDAVAQGLDPHESCVAKTPEGLGTQITLAGSGGSGTVTLTTETMDVRLDNDSGWTTITFSSPADMAAVASQINSQYGDVIATVNGNNIDLTSLIYGKNSQVETQNVTAAITTQVGIINDSDVSGTGFTAVGAGVGKTLEAPTSASSYNTIDGKLLTIGSRVLVSAEGGADSVADVDNGIYQVTTLGDDASALFKMTRTTDCDVASSTEFHQGTYAFIVDGTTYENTGWSCITNVVTVDTTANQWTQFSGAPGLTYDQGLKRVISSIQVELDTSADAATSGAAGGSSGLEFDTDTASGKLRVRVSPTGGIDRLSDGIGLDLDGTTLQLDAGGAGTGLSVLGLPSSFEINGVATTGANVTAANLDDLSDGSNADSLHVHTASSVSLDHSDLGNVTSDQHHAQSHAHDGVDGSGTVAHSDTTGQGANDHHNQAHAIDGADHTATGLTAGHVLTALTPTTFGFAAAAEADAAKRVENTINTAVDTVAVADPVYVNGDETVGKARADDDVKSRVIGLIRTGSGAAPQAVEVVEIGLCAGILTGATPGTPYYLGSTGGLTTSPPGSGNRVILVGYASGDTDLMVRITDYGKKA